MSIFRMLKVTREINEADLKAAIQAAPDRPVVLPDGFAIEPGPLPAEAQIMLRVMGEDLPVARELIKAMSPRDRAILIFYTTEIGMIVNEVNQEEGRY